MASNVIKGRAYITSDDSLVQEQLTADENYKITEELVVLINNIWDNLIWGTETYEVHTGLDGNFFYWTYTMTMLNGEEAEMFLDCPAPKTELFEYPYNEEDYTTDYAKFWVKKFNAADKRNIKFGTISPQYVVFPPYEYQSSSEEGGTVEVEGKEVVRTDISDLDNLLLSFM